MIKLIYLLGFILLFSCQFKKQTVFELSDFYLNYKGQQGSSDFSLYIGPKQEAPPKMQVEFEVKDSNLYTYFPGITYVAEIPSILNGVKELAIENFNLFLAQNTAHLSLDNYLSIDDETKNLEDVTLDCIGASSEEQEILDSILDACLSKGDLRFYSFKDADDFEITNAKASIRNSFIYFEGQIHSTINGKFKLEGKADFNRSSRTFSLRVDKVKFGILSIKGKFFKELKKMEGDSFKVNEPYLYYQF